MRSRIAIACVTRGRCEQVARLWRSVLALAPPPDSMWCVVQEDTDGTEEMLRRDFPEVAVRVFPDNGGVWGGMNRVYDWVWPDDKSGPDLLFMVDDDGWLPDQDTVTQIRRAMSGDDWGVPIGIVQARIVETGRVDQGDAGRDLAQFTGGANVMTRDVWHRIGPYPGWMFRSSAETLLSHRLHTLGLRIRYDPRVRMVHEPAQTGRDTRRFHDDSIRNRYLVAVMIGGLWPLYWIGHFGRSIGRLLMGRPGRPLHAFVDACRLLPRARAEAQRWPVSASARRNFRALMK